MNSHLRLKRIEQQPCFRLRLLYYRLKSLEGNSSECARLLAPLENEEILWIWKYSLTQEVRAHGREVVESLLIAENPEWEDWVREWFLDGNMDIQETFEWVRLYCHRREKE